MSMFNKVLEYRRKAYIRNLTRKGLFIGKNVCIVDTFFFDPSHCYLVSIGDHYCPNVDV
jgi:maltose O-acetyltransferase